MISIHVFCFKFRGKYGYFCWIRQTGSLIRGRKQQKQSNTALEKENKACHYGSAKIPSLIRPGTSAVFKSGGGGTVSNYSKSKPGCYPPVTYAYFGYWALNAQGWLCWQEICTWLQCEILLAETCHGEDHRVQAIFYEHFCWV